MFSSSSAIFAAKLEGDPEFQDNLVPDEYLDCAKETLGRNLKDPVEVLRKQCACLMFGVGMDR